MKRKPDTTLQDLLELLDSKVDYKTRCLLESLLGELKIGDLANHFDTDKKKDSLPHFGNLEHLRKLLKQIEEKIEALLERIVCLLKQLKVGVKRDSLERRRILKLILELINLINLKNVLEGLLANLEKAIKR